MIATCRGTAWRAGRGGTDAAGSTTTVPFRVGFSPFRLLDRDEATPVSVAGVALLDLQELLLLLLAHRVQPLNVALRQLLNRTLGTVLVVLGHIIVP